MSPIIRVDVGWVLQIQSAISPLNVPIADWGALGLMADRHTFERERGALYYEEVPSRTKKFPPALPPSCTPPCCCAPSPTSTS
ncbi:hypothetical protein [Streptomyces sp. NPDC001530]|uniref:hypothetical protein n=1 Tax=Streptomyces sp. NPDC001530 TaxID=3364582 RepID=UPI0036855F11